MSLPLFSGDVYKRQFLDRIERADGKDDFRLKAFRTALGELSNGKKEKAKNVLLDFSDLTIESVSYTHLFA